MPLIDQCHKWSSVTNWAMPSGDRTFSPFGKQTWCQFFLVPYVILIWPTTVRTWLILYRTGFLFFLKLHTGTWFLPVLFTDDVYSGQDATPSSSGGAQRHTHKRRIKTEEKAKVVTAVWGTELFKFVATLAISHQDDLKKRMIRITASWRNGCFGNMNDHPVQTIPNHHPTKMDVLPKPFVQIILAAKWLVRHSSTSPN